MITSALSIDYNNKGTYYSHEINIRVLVVPEDAFNVDGVTDQQHLVGNPFAQLVAALIPSMTEADVRTILTAAAAARLNPTPASTWKPNTL